VTKLPEVELASLRKIAPGDLRLLWVNDWYDGPLEAVVEHDGERCLMVLHHEDPTAEEPYCWLVVQLTAAQYAEEERWHALYAELVGDHWCFHGDGARHDTSGAKPTAEELFSEYRTRPPLDVVPSAVVGWADEMPAH
jgi:hypothetical protein